jgi:4-amino-4-deoxy-L-arabinose transferase-like glycosyltransferase
MLASLAVLAALGLLVADDYGQSWDEFFNDKAGARSLSAYLPGSLLRDQHEDYFHGTFYLMIYSGVSRLLSTLPLGLERVDVRHYLNYLTFLLALASGFSLAAALAGRPAAWMTAALMLSQPLYIGHAFINQKDLPFLAFFTASLALGVSATRSLEKRLTSGATPAAMKPVSLAAGLASARQAWGNASRPARFAVLAISLLGALAIADLLGEWVVYPALERTLEQAYAQQAPAPVNRFFRALAEDASKTPLAAYQSRLRVAYFALQVVGVPLALALVLASWKRLIGPSPLVLPAVQDSANRRLISAGAVLGLTTAIRVIGPFAGALVALYMIVRLRRRAVRAILAYGLTAAVVTYLAWPALWGDPLNEFWTRLAGSVRFAQPHEVFFEGEIIPSTDLPAHYLPKLLAIQFTIPVLLAVPAGLLIIRRLTGRREADGALGALLLLWIGLPTLAQLLFNVPLYGNGRQMLFITMPLVMFAGVGWAAVLQRSRRRSAQTLVVFLALAQGAVHLLRFHPYEYVYYNELVGGVRGAEGRYELDYWCTSYRELTEWLNGQAPPDSTVIAWGPVEAAAEFARSDLLLTAEASSLDQADYRMACGRGLLDAAFLARTEPVYDAWKGGLTLGRVGVVTAGP